MILFRNGVSFSHESAFALDSWFYIFPILKSMSKFVEAGQSQCCLACRIASCIGLTRFKENDKIPQNVRKVISDFGKRPCSKMERTSLKLCI